MCLKEFKHKSKLNEHMNNKNPCNKPKDSTECNLCKKNFPCLAKLEKHKQSNKHIKNENQYNIINNIENLNIYIFPEGTKAFIETNLAAIGPDDIHIPFKSDKKLISTINDLKADELYPSNDAYLTFFKYFIKIFKKLNFNLAFTENNNCLIFSFTKNDINNIEYQVLTINNVFNKYETETIKYKQFMEELINLLKRVDVRFPCADFTFILNYVIKYKQKYEDDEHIKDNVEKELLKEYNIFKGVKDQQTLDEEEMSNARIMFVRENTLRDLKFKKYSTINRAIGY
jgi:hypothetical protein